MCVVYLFRFARRKRKQQRKYIVAMVTALPQLWRHALRSASNGARVRLRSSPTPNVHRGERRYHVKTVISFFVTFALFVCYNV